MNYVFGPIISRRLGRSLGIDPIPFKTCNWNCVYCQLGRTGPLVNVRQEYVAAADILAELRSVLDGHSPGEIDWVTFVGSGEPTLHAGLGRMIREAKAMSQLPIAVITNGTLLDREDVRRELLAADAVLPTVDAGSELLYRKINRPHPDLTLERLVSGLVAFRQSYHGQLWVEVMLMKGLNDSDQALADLALVLQRIHPDEVHINLPVRPPCEPWVEPAEEDRILHAVRLFGEVAHVVHPKTGSLLLETSADVEDAVVAVVTRHPLREDELLRGLSSWGPKKVLEALEQLRAAGRAQLVVRHGERFWAGAAAKFNESRGTGRDP